MPPALMALLRRARSFTLSIGQLTYGSFLLLLVLIVFDRRIVMTFRFALKSLSRNLLRSILTALAVIREDSVLGCWCHPPLCHTWVVWDEWLRLYALRPAA